ncbi:monocarboxylate transporter 10 [Musca domestica]|uniref:Major Facilitator Superfamily protein n=1 Tax=Musca domestica TaxID=7370 RepID=T1PDW7_MUSDO|nr:monocarboxylate transporter 10 [Musca domestica]XP_005177097.1 monocarboxylate transporter 10 [Musca domestica]XP_058987059.1 monocarboxylate transporter 10 [Musca domestica]XP_058987060.1 monocarboxylate transporter 10 [Musca domestica]
MAATQQNHRNVTVADEPAASDSLVAKTTNNHQSQDGKEQFEDVDNATAAVVVPPDSGWAWVVMVASFLCCTIIDGIVFCSGFIQDDLIKEFNVSKFYVSFVSSLLSGCYLMAGPFVSAMANRFGFRPVTIAGALFAAVCFVASSYVNSIELLMVVYGVLGGIGFCMVYIPAVVIIGFYFEKWRALATGIAMCGSGVGTFVFAPLSNYLLKNYDWRTMLQVQGLIIVACAIIGIAFRPIQPLTLAVTENGVEEDNKNKANGHGNSVAPKPQFATNAFSKPLPEGRFAYSMPNSAHNTYMGASPKHHYPTAAEVFKGANLERRLSGASGKGTEMKNLRKSQPTTPNGEQQQMTFNLHKELTTVGENEEETENENLLVTEAKPTIVQARRHTVSGRRPQNIGSRSNVGSQDGVNNTVTRPMYRDDAFFTGSLTRIPQYQSQSSLAYHMSVTRLPTKQDELEERESGCHLCPEAVRRTLSTMLDVTLLKSPSFMCLAFSGFLTMMGFFVPFTFLKPRAVEGGMDDSAALQVVSAIGYFNTIARIFCGSITSFPSVKPLWLNNIAITAGGIATICSGFYISTGTQWTFAVLFGFCIACFSALRSLIAVEMIGLEKLTNAFGFLMLFQGIAATIGSPIAGALYDATKDYNACFYFAGGLILLSAFLCYPLPAVARWENKRNEKKNALPQA